MWNKNSLVFINNVLGHSINEWLIGCRYGIIPIAGFNEDKELYFEFDVDGDIMYVTENFEIFSTKKPPKAVSSQFDDAVFRYVEREDGCLFISRSARIDHYQFVDNVCDIIDILFPEQPKLHAPRSIERIKINCCYEVREKLTDEEFASLVELVLIVPDITMEQIINIGHRISRGDFNRTMIEILKLDIFKKNFLRLTKGNWLAYKIWNTKISVNLSMPPKVTVEVVTDDKKFVDKLDKLYSERLKDLNIDVRAYDDSFLLFGYNGIVDITQCFGAVLDVALEFANSLEELPLPEEKYYLYNEFLNKMVANNYNISKIKNEWLSLEELM